MDDHSFVPLAEVFNFGHVLEFSTGYVSVCKLQQVATEVGNFCYIWTLRCFWFAKQKHIAY